MRRSVRTDARTGVSPAAFPSTPDNQPVPFEPGSRLGRIRIDALIGVGGMGSVGLNQLSSGYSGRSTGHNRSSVQMKS